LNIWCRRFDQCNKFAKLLDESWFALQASTAMTVSFVREASICPLSLLLDQGHQHQPHDVTVTIEASRCHHRVLFIYRARRSVRLLSYP
jgi:hypothetical protein